MVNYKLMYHILFSAISDAVDLMSHRRGDDHAKALLINAMQKTEEMYIDSTED